MEDGCCLLFRNLKKKCSPEELRTLLLQLLNEVVLLNIPLRKRDITVEGEPDETKIALVYLRSKKDLDKTLQFVDSYDNRRRLTFNFDDIIEPCAHCSVLPIFHRPGRYYIEGEILTTVDGANEFRSGVGSYVNILMKDDLSKFICASLNSGLSKTFCVGVQENGCVLGVQMSPQKEDIVRKDVIERSITDIKPPVMPWNYTLEFIQILENGILKDGYKVIEVTVNQLDNLKELYEVKGDYYICRNGGKAEPMKPRDVQQWYQHVCDREVQKKDVEKREILEQMNKPTGKTCTII